MIGSVHVLWKNWTVRRIVLLGDCNPVGKPSRPPAVGTNCNNGVITQRRDGHIHNRRMSDWIHNIGCVYVSPAPSLIVTKYNKQHSFPAVCEVRHWSTKIAGGWCVIAYSFATSCYMISSSNVNHNSHEFPVFPVLRTLLFQPPPCRVQYVWSESEIIAKLFFDSLEIFVRRHRVPDAYVAGWQVFESSVVDCVTNIIQTKRASVWTL